MKALILSDIHGANLKYEDLISKTQPDLIIIPGDLCSSIDIPSLALSYLSRKNRNGYVRNFYERFFERAIMKQISSSKIILNRLLEFNLPVIVIHGNTEMDQTRSWLYLYSLRNDNLHYISDNSIVLQDYLFVGHGWVASENNKDRGFTPGDVDNDISRKILLDTLGRANKTVKKRILISHTPPYGTPIDFLKHRGKHVGSKPIREMLDSGYFDGNICGHLHESYGTIKYPKWWSVNAGAAVEDRACLIDLESLQIAWISKIIKNGNVESILYQSRRKLNYDE